ncbi:MAG: class I SAM-dependent methyltransferase [bacterium]|nr:class I SAM-dependent methyltransferase [bacterium]
MPKNNQSSDTTTCSACGSPDLEVFFEVADIPVLVCALWPDEASARSCPRGDIRLSVCTRCGLVENRDFQPALVEYQEGYENSLHFSEFFQGYIQDFAEHLVQHHRLKNKRIVEIGSGDGEFLSLLCELGPSSGVGFDPSYPPGRPETALGGRVQFVREYFGPEHADLAADLVVCRQVLEHIPRPVEFLEGVRQALDERPDASVVMEVPNARDTFRRISLWDVVYEHCTYFGRASLARLLSHCGFDVKAASETYAGQFLSVEASPAFDEVGDIPADVDDALELERDRVQFANGWEKRVDVWRQRIADAEARGRRMALWGAGARGVNFLNLVDPDARIEHIVDKNPRKHGRHLAGTGQAVADPRTLANAAPDFVVVMNPNYENEIRRELADMGLSPEVLVA